MFPSDSTASHGQLWNPVVEQKDLVWPVMNFFTWNLSLIERLYQKMLNRVNSNLVTCLEINQVRKSFWSSAGNLSLSNSIRAAKTSLSNLEEELDDLLEGHTDIPSSAFLSSYGKRPLSSRILREELFYLDNLLKEDTGLGAPKDHQESTSVGNNKETLLQAQAWTPYLPGTAGKKVKGKCLKLLYPVTTAKIYFCSSILGILLVTVFALSVALLLRRKVEVIERTVCTACPRNWIGLGNKCFYFSEDARNWTFSHTSCIELEAQLARFESLEELNFLRRYKGDYDHWIGLHRESSQHAWKWADGTDYNSLVSVRGEGECAYLNDKGISSARYYVDRKWACSKPVSHIQ